MSLSAIEVPRENEWKSAVTEPSVQSSVMARLTSTGHSAPRLTETSFIPSGMPSSGGAVVGFSPAFSSTATRRGPEFAFRGADLQGRAAAEDETEHCCSRCDCSHLRSVLHHRSSLDRSSRGSMAAEPNQIALQTLLVVRNQAADLVSGIAQAVAGCRMLSLLRTRLAAVILLRTGLTPIPLLRSGLTPVLLLWHRLAARSRHRSRLRPRRRSRLRRCWCAAHAGARLELGMLTGIRWEPTADRLSGRTVDQVCHRLVPGDASRCDAECPEFGPAARPHSAAEAARIRGSDASREAVRVGPEETRPRRARPDRPSAARSPARHRRAPAAPSAPRCPHPPG